MKRLTLIVVAALGTGLLGAGSLGAHAVSRQPPAAQTTTTTTQATDLAPRFVVGAPMHYRHILTMTQKQRYNKFAEGTISLQMISHLRLTPTRLLPGGGAEVELSFDRLSVDAVPSKASRFQYDTETDHDRPDSEAYVRAIRRVAETVVIFQLDAAGQAQSVVGAREIERLIEGQPGFELIASVLTERWLREVAQDVFGPAGEKPERTIGDTWRTNLAITIGGFPGARTSVDWTYTSNNDGVAIIEGDAHAQPPVRTDPNLAGLTQKVTGAFTKFSIVWDLKRHRTQSVEKSEAMNLDYRSDDYLFGTTTLGTHSLLESLDP